jgi:hypothetical protein
LSLRERAERIQRGAEVVVAKVPEAPVVPKGGRLPPRDELLADIRRRLQEEVIDSFESLRPPTSRPRSAHGSSRSSIGSSSSRRSP